MEKQVSRRSAMQRLMAASLGLFTLPLWLSRNESKESKADDSDAKHADLSAVRTQFPLGFQWEVQDPFLMCVHHEDFFPAGNEYMGPARSYFKGRQLGDDFIIKDGFRMYHGKTVPGFPGHPHRGFETITVVRQGIVDHADSLGAAGRYGNGDVQWMTAGKGVQHSEMFPLISTTDPNPMELFQVWLNLPKKNKMVEPHFKMLWRESIPKWTLDDDRVMVELIAGSWASRQAVAPPPDSWAAADEHGVFIANITMKPGASLILPVGDASWNRTLYFYEGDRMEVNEHVWDKYSGAHMNAHIATTLKALDTEIRVFILQGKPIGEPVMQYGPFVMNTKEEIKQAFEDYHQTKFGGWPWPKYDQVHDRSRPRFAQHADGSSEVKQG